MNLAYENLSPEIRRSVEDDIDTVQRLADRHSRGRLGLWLKVVALDGRDLPVGLPPHQLATPAGRMPGPLAERCDWQVLRDSYQIVADDSATWVIAGSGSGAMYGVNEVLRCATGVIWASPQEDEALFGPTRPLPRGVQRPRFAYRGIYGGPRAWMARNRLNFGMAGAAYWATKSDEQRQADAAAVRAREINLTLSEHAMDYYLPAAVLAEHPEWAALREGSRRTRTAMVVPECPDLTGETPTQPCFSNEAAAEFITDRMAAFREALPGLPFFGVWPHDGVNNWCQCDACRRKSPYEHLHDLARRLRAKLRTETVLELITYSNMLNLPRRPLAPDDRMYAFFCPYLRHFRHRVFEPGGPEWVETGTRYPEPDRINPVDEREYGRLFEAWLPVWRDAGTVPALFEYPGRFIDETGRTDHQRYLCPPAAQLREDEAVWYAGRGVRLAILCGGIETWPDHFPTLAWAQSLWGGEAMAEVRDRYYAALAGWRGSQLAEAVDGVAEALRRSDGVPEAALRNLEDVLACLPESPQVHRYRDWTEHIRLGRTARSLARAGRFAESAEFEKRVREFVRQARDRIPVADFLLRDSEAYERRMRRRLGNGR